MIHPRKSKRFRARLLKTPARALAAATICLAIFTSHALSQSSYDAQLARLAEILGSVHFLRTLCGEKDGSWRTQMEALLLAEEASDERKEMLISSFNRGYRSFAAVYSNCTENALLAIGRYMKEGETLSTEIIRRYAD